MGRTTSVSGHRSRRHVPRRLGLCAAGVTIMAGCAGVPAANLSPAARVPRIGILSAFAPAVRERAEGLIVIRDPLTNTNRPAIVALAARHRLPAMYASREFGLQIPESLLAQATEVIQ